MEEFAGRSAIVTGAGGGMGLAIAAGLAAHGAHVVGVDLKARPAELSGGGSYLAADVSDEATAAAAVEAALGATGTVDYLVNAAGVALVDEDVSIAEMDVATWHRVLAINLTGPMLFARAALPAMCRQGRGAMVHIASIAGIRTSDGPMDAYQAAKAGLMSLSRGIAANHGHEGVRSNTISPGAILTPMIAPIYDADPARQPAMEARVPLRRVGYPADIADAALFLLGDRASYVTGTDLVVDGGWTIPLA